MQELLVVDEKDLATPTVCNLIARALGPNGLGAVAVRLAPNTLATYARRREHVLRAARYVARLPVARRDEALRAQHFGTDLAARGFVCAITDTLRFRGKCDSIQHDSTIYAEQQTPVSYDSSIELRQSDVAALGEQLLDIAVRVADACTAALQCGVEFGALVRESGTAKARIIHYGPTKSSDDTTRGMDTLLWQPWHADYGIFTVLTAPMFAVEIDSAEYHDIAPPLEDCPSRTSGLVLATASVGVVPVVIPTDCILVQVGETASILSGGLLRASPHAVRRPCEGPSCVSCVGHEEGWPMQGTETHGRVSRTTLALFLQPAWAFPLNPPDGITPDAVLSASGLSCSAITGRDSLPLLSQRWIPGQSFSDFGRSTTAAYYGRRRNPMA